MMKKITIFLISFVFIFFISACTDSNIVLPVPEPGNEEESSINIESFIMVKGNPEKVIDCTPELVIFTEKENVEEMSFSGNGEEWSEWVDYKQSYSDFNIASGLNGTEIESGDKIIYVRFRDEDGKVFPADNQISVCCNFKYEMQELFVIIIEPKEAKVKPGGSVKFSIHGYDLKFNEVPLYEDNISWTKGCDVGKLEPLNGLMTTYTAPEIPGLRNISAHYGSLGTGAKIFISQE